MSPWLRYFPFLSFLCFYLKKVTYTLLQFPSRFAIIYKNRSSEKKTCKLDHTSWASMDFFLCFFSYHSCRKRKLDISDFFRPSQSISRFQYCVYMGPKRRFNISACFQRTHVWTLEEWPPDHLHYVTHEEWEDYS